MVFGPNMIPAEQIFLYVAPGSDAWCVALMNKQFPGSRLPNSEPQPLRMAAPQAQLVSASILCFERRRLENFRLPFEKV